MHTIPQVALSDFFIVGINYKKTDAFTRGLYTINDDQYNEILRLAPTFNINALFILSTCNRTEIYCLADQAAIAVDLLCTQTRGDRKTFINMAYTKRGADAVSHLFNVGAGLDSQIIGDYEIIGQLKKAVKFSKERGFLNCFLERLVNNVLQSSKTIKNETSLSTGVVSVAFAAVQYILKNSSIHTDKKVLMIGSGKIGRNTCKNLIDYLGTRNITLINRTVGKAAELANELGLNYAPIADLDKHIRSADIILTATNAPEPIVLMQHLEKGGDKIIIDLSVPYNVESGAGMLENIKLINIDMLSKFGNEAIQKRNEDVPLAKHIIEQQMANFMEWYRMHKNGPALNAFKMTLTEIYRNHPNLLANSGMVCPVKQVQRVLNAVAHKMRGENQHGCHYIQAINELIST